jgi:endo-1,4-beta-xylanase
VSSVHNPSITVYLPAKEKATGVGLVICPGGGHSNLAIEHEGYNVGKWMADHGIAGFVLKYRLAREQGSTYTIEGHALADTQRAMRTVRARAAEWGVDPARVGVMGFSAGGELAALVSVRNDNGNDAATDPVEKIGCKPNFQALIYPGQSGKIQPKEDSPPVFMACGNNDRPDISEGLANVYLLFKKAKVPAELHIYAGVGHGFGIRDRNPASVLAWPTEFNDWLMQVGMLKKP